MKKGIFTALLLTIILYSLYLVNRWKSNNVRKGMPWMMILWLFLLVLKNRGGLV